MTLTEVAEYYAQMQIKQGLLTQKQWKGIKRDSLILAIGIIFVAIALAVLIFVWL